MPSDTIQLITAAIGRVHSTPAAENSPRPVPMALPNPFQLAVKAKDNESRDIGENRRGIARVYPWASSSRSSTLCSLCMTDGSSALVCFVMVVIWDMKGGG